MCSLKVTNVERTFRFRSAIKKAENLCNNLFLKYLRQLIVLAGLIAVSLAAPLDDSKNAQILKYESDNIGIGGYKFR